MPEFDLCLYCGIENCTLVKAINTSERQSSFSMLTSVFISRLCNRVVYLCLSLLSDAISNATISVSEGK